MTEQQVRDEVEKGVSAVRIWRSAPTRHPPGGSSASLQLEHNQAMVAYFGTCNVAMFSTEIDSFRLQEG